MTELNKLVDVFKVVGGDPAVFDDERLPHLMVLGHSLVSSNSLPGLAVATSTHEDHLKITIKVQEGVRVEAPVHTCIGLLHARGEQNIMFDVVLEPESSVRFITHCLFPHAEQIHHKMQAQIRIGSGASMEYQERHFHGPHGGIVVIPKTMVNIDSGGRYHSDFKLVDGLAGNLALAHDVQVGDHAVAELTARVFGHAEDELHINERISLIGENARGIIKTRIAVEGNAQAEVSGITEGKAAGARGHVDCLEIVRDHAVARAVPIICVTNPQAKVTHEASIGSVDHHQLETLMAHGVSPEEAVDIIVKGMLG